MGMFDGFPFVSKEERDRRKRDSDKRLVPYGLEEQRKCLKKTLNRLFPDLSSQDALYVYYDAKDAYTKNEKGEPGRIAAMKKLKAHKWIDDRKLMLFMKLIELESEIESLEDFPTAEDVIQLVYPNEDL